MRYCSGAVILAALLSAGCLSQSGLQHTLDQAREEAYQEWTRRSKETKETEVYLEGALQLQDALRLSFRNNKDIQSILLERVKASGQGWEAWSEALPSVSLSSSYARLDDKESAPANELDSYSNTLTITQPVFEGGSIYANLRKIPIYRALADESIRDTAEDVFYNVTKAYYDTLLAERLSEVNKASMLSAQAQLNNVNRKREAEAATKFDVLRAEVDVSNFRASMIREKNNAELSKATLLRLMGVSQQSEVSLEDALHYVAMKPVLEAAVKSAYKKRPDLRQAELNIRQQEEAVRIARSSYFPQVSLSLSRLWSKPHPHYTTVSDADGWGDKHTASVTASWTLFDGLKREGELRQEVATLKQKNIALLDAQETALLEIRKAMLSLRNAEELVESQKKNEERALEGLRLAELGYREGVNAEVEVVEARKALTEARGNFYEALYSHALSRVQLQKAMGLLAPDRHFGKTAVAESRALPALPARVEEFE